MKLQTIFSAWNDFWFAPRSPAPMALYRIAFGFLMFIYGLLVIHDFDFWFGQYGVLSLKASRFIYPAPAVNLFALMPSGNTWAMLFLSLFVLAAAMLTVGFMTRLSAIVVYVGFLSINHRLPLVMNSGNIFTQICALFLIFSDAGLVFSIDRILRIARGKEVGQPLGKALWAQRLVQLQLSFLYFWTFFSKAHDKEWVNGVSIYYVSRDATWRRMPIPFYEYLPAIKFYTWGTLLTEFLLGTLVWVLEYRYCILFAGFLFHLGLEYSMDLALFQWTVIAAYLTFIEPQHQQAFMERIRSIIAGKFGGPAPVLYDGSCEVCMRLSRLIQAWDILGRFSLVDSREKHGLLVYCKTDVPLSGFEAWKQIALRLPIFWLFVPLLFGPGVRIFMKKVFKRFSEHQRFLFGVQCLVS